MRPVSFHGRMSGSKVKAGIGRGSQTEAAQGGTARLVEGEGASFPVGTRRYLQRQRSLPDEQRSDDGRLPAAQSRRGVSGWLAGGHRRGLSKARTGVAPSGLHRHRESGEAQQALEILVAAAVEEEPRTSPPASPV